MLLFLFVIMVLVGILMIAVSSRYDIMELVGGIAVGLGLIGTVCCVLVVGINHMGVDATVAKLNTRYDNIMFQYWNDIYENDNDVGKRELYADIQKWNEELAYNQEIQDDLWVGIFIPDIYDQFEFIELEVSYG